MREKYQFYLYNIAFFRIRLSYVIYHHKRTQSMGYRVDNVIVSAGQPAAGVAGGGGDRGGPVHPPRRRHQPGPRALCRHCLLTSRYSRLQVREK